MQIVLIRHGQPEWVRDGLNVVDPLLTELGHEQAARAAEALVGEEFDEIVVSPLRRARETAAPLLERQGRNEDDRVVAARDPRTRLARVAGGAGGQGLRRGAVACRRGAVARRRGRRGLA